jgi:hypothetical protein
VRAFRSNSLRGRMLIITKNAKNKDEFLVLPMLPSKLEAEEDGDNSVRLQFF